MTAQTAHRHDVRIPPAALISGFAIIVFTIAAAAFARHSGVGRSAPPDAARVESRALRFEDRPDGAVLVRDAKAGSVVDVLQPGSFGFVRVAMRGLARDRKIHAVGAEPPFMLTRWSDHRVTLDDPATGRSLDLAAFGRPNAEAFERLLDRNGEAR